MENSTQMVDSSEHSVQSENIENETERHLTEKQTANCVESTDQVVLTDSHSIKNNDVSYSKNECDVFESEKPVCIVDSISPLKTDCCLTSKIMSEYETNLAINTRDKQLLEDKDTGNNGSGSNYTDNSDINITNVKSTDDPETEIVNNSSSSVIMEQSDVHNSVETSAVTAQTALKSSDSYRLIDYDIASDDSDSDSGDDSSSSTSSSDGDLPSLTNIIDDRIDDEDDGQDLKSVKPPRTKGELLLEDLPKIEELHIEVPDDVTMVQLGQVSGIVGVLVVIEANKHTPALDVDSILFYEDRKPIGQVFEIFGPVPSPYYCIRFNNVEDIVEHVITIGMLVYCAPTMQEYTHYVFLTQLKKMKGSDASWENNNEPPPKYLEFSDDEEERRIKKKAKGGGKRQLKRDGEDDQNQMLSSNSADQIIAPNNANNGGPRPAFHPGFRHPWRGTGRFRLPPRHQAHGPPPAGQVQNPWNRQDVSIRHHNNQGQWSTRRPSNQISHTPQLNNQPDPPWAALPPSGPPSAQWTNQPSNYGNSSWRSNAQCQQTSSVSTGNNRNSTHNANQNCWPPRSQSMEAPPFVFRTGDQGPNIRPHQGYGSLPSQQVNNPWPQTRPQITYDQQSQQRFGQQPQYQQWP